MLFHPIMLEVMARLIADQSEREARLMCAVHADPLRHQSALRSWLARTLLRAALRLDSTVRERPVKRAVPATSD